MQIELSEKEVESLIMVLGELPTKSNAYPLMVKIAEQANAQISTDQTEDGEVDEAA